MIQFFSRKLKNRKGFTIIELLVVIALLGILAGIAVPRMTGLTSGAKEKADMASMQTLLRDAQVGLASGQIDPATDLDTDKNIKAEAGKYFTAIPTPQTQNTAASGVFQINIVALDTTNDPGVYTITVKHSLNADSTDAYPDDISGQAEYIAD